MKDFPKLVNQPGASVRQVSGYDREGKPILSVLAKARYKIRAGVCTEPELAELLLLPKFSDDESFMVEDADVFPDKLTTDIIVRGTIFGNGRSTAEAGIELPGKRSVWKIFGKRVVIEGGKEGFQFSQPEPFEEIELSFTNAYGGIAHHAENSATPPWKETYPPYLMQPEDTPPYSTPFSYTRNPVGKGFVIGESAEAALGVELPNIELAEEPLTPENFLCPDLWSWPQMPLPAPVGVVSYEWFPRSAYVRMVRPYHGHITKFSEVEKEGAPQEIRDPMMECPAIPQHFASGAPVQLQHARLLGGEQITTWGIGTGGNLAFRVPAPPEMWVDGRNGSLKPAEVVLHTMIIDIDQEEVTLVWRGSTSALRPYLPEELEKMPLKVQWK